MDEDLDAISLHSDGTLRLISEDSEDSVSLREKLREELDSIDSAGTFASFTSLDVDPDFVDPKIEINNIGVINTPLVAEDVPRLIEAANPSPFGRGDQTIVDPSVRSSWELDAKQFRITNPLWPIFMDKLLGMVSMVLGVPIYEIKAHLYNMLLYGKGAHFKPHQDSEKEPNMFGTLVICLPAPHRGGDVIAQLGEQKRILRTSECSKSCLFWYSDVQYEVTEVTAGHRWVLTYNLVRPDYAPKPRLRREYPLLKRTLGSWRKACDREDFWKKQHFVYVLEHNYTQANLAFDKLKGIDTLQARVLQDYGEASGFCVFLANIAEIKCGGASDNPVRRVDDQRRGRRKSFHPIIDVVDTEVRLTRVFDFAGRAVAGNIIVDAEESRLLKRGQLGKGDPDAEDYNPYTCNGGHDTTHWYRQAAIVLMPWEHVPEFLTAKLRVPRGDWTFDEENYFQFNLEDTIEFLLSELHKQPDKAVIRGALENFCSLYAAKEGKPSLWMMASYAGTMLQAAIKCDNPRIFAIGSVGAKNGQLSDVASRALSSWLFEKGFSYLEPSLSQFVALHTSIHQVYHLCSGIMRPTEAFYEERKRESEESGLGSWISERLNETMSQSSNVTDEDGEALARILAFSDDRDNVMLSVTDAVQRNISNTSFVLAFLRRLEGSISCHPERLPGDLGWKIYGEIAAQCIRHLDLRSAEQKSGEAVPATGGKRSMQFPSKSSTPEIELRNPAVRGIDLTDMFDVLHCTLEAENLVDKLFERIQAEANRTDVDFFPEQLIDFLHYLGEHVGSLGIDRVRPLYYNVIESYLMQGIGKAYKEPSWSRPRINCPCGTCYCRAVDQFLSDPKRSGASLKLKFSAHEHLRQKLADRPAIKLETDRGILRATLYIVKLPDEQYHEAQRLKRRHKEFDDQMEALESVVDLREILGIKYNYLVKKRALWWTQSKTSGT